MFQMLKQMASMLKPYILSKLSLSLVIAGLLSSISLNIKLSRVEAFLYDLRMKWKHQESLHPDLTLLVMGEKDAKEITPQEWLTTAFQYQLLEKVLREEPKMIVYLQLPDSFDVQNNPLEAEKFVALAQQGEKNGVKVILGTDVDLGGEVLPPYPLSLLPHAPAILHKDGTIFGEDKVMRRGLLNVFQEPSLHMRVAFPEMQKDALIEKAKELRGAYYFKPADSWHVLTNYPQTTTNEGNAFPKIYLSDFLNKADRPSLKGKIVLIGSLRRDAISDYAFTPYSSITYTNPRLYVHASIIHTLLQNNGIVIIPFRAVAILTFLLTLLLTAITIGMQPPQGILTLSLLSSGLFAFSLLLFQWGIWLRLVQPLLSMFFTYYLIVPYRAIMEYRKRWEVQEKHDLLVQVEEMKGNFLSLMSHDLKTPVAQIQGLAETVIRQGNLSEDQKNEMNLIISSTENLDKFISKILNLTKVESNEIKIEKKSKDINKILEQCSQKLEFLAKSKGIHIERQLEPLFPLPLDAALINQVFTNIIDNAIKYSPPGSWVRIHSQEVGNFVSVTIEDNGPGMEATEKEQLFTKFFRGKKQREEQSKGSGLGLYLTKYFIELHSGTIEVFSEKNVGTKFVIRLPINELG